MLTPACFTLSLKREYRQCVTMHILFGVRLSYSLSLFTDVHTHSLVIPRGLFLSKVSILLAKLLLLSIKLSYYYRNLHEFSSQQDQGPGKEYYYPNAVQYQFLKRKKKKSHLLLFCMYLCLPSVILLIPAHLSILLREENAMFHGNILQGNNTHGNFQYTCQCCREISVSVFHFFPSFPSLHSSLRTITQSSP